MQSSNSHTFWRVCLLSYRDVIKGLRKTGGNLYIAQINRDPCAAHIPYLSTTSGLLISGIIGCAFSKGTFMKIWLAGDSSRLGIIISAMHTNEPLFLYFMLLTYLEVNRCSTNLKREAVRFSYRDTLHKIPEACVTQRKQTAYVCIGHTCWVGSSSACERQIPVFELERNNACSKKVHFFWFYFAKLNS